MAQGLKAPRITVIVLIYNDGDLGCRAIESVLEQSFAEFRLLILDNGSTDDTPAKLKKFSVDPRVEIITNPVNQRSEFAVRIAKTVETDYLSFLFSDDYYFADRLDRLVKMLDQNAGYAAVFANNEFVDERGREIGNIPSTQFSGDVSALSAEQHLNHIFLRGNSLHPCAMLIRTQVYQELGGFKPFLHRLGDMNFFARLLCEREVFFVNDKTQAVTLWMSGRNESSSANIDWTALSYERILLLETYRSKKFLEKAEKVFPQLTAKLSPNADLNEKLFWTAQVAFLVPAMDYRLFAMKCFYNSYEANPEQIDAVCIRYFKMTFSQFISFVQDGGLGETQPRLAKLKKILKKNKILRPVVQLAKRLM